ncbi:unnamed protein product [Microthlaspi erraticum]|uniref:MULE transposase domain-containing protein n=1 Tax=Microthlaspi erraticum TaxID=1685480 RepID=A0A6D2I0V5_9BRAS|nr:unnamed protein product [Microthlaspi erraticum]
MFDVRKANLKHTCDADSRRTFSKHASSKVIAALLRTKYETTVGPRPKDLPYSILREHHINASYWKCWKAKELAIASAHGTEESSYKLLPLYLYLLKCANPGSITHLHTEVDEKGATRFKYAFMALKACVDGWKHLRKILVVDGTHMFGKYRGCLLTASGQDANFQVFPIAFAVKPINQERDTEMVSKFPPRNMSYPLTRNVDDHYKRRHQRALVQQAGEAFYGGQIQEVLRWFESRRQKIEKMHGDIPEEVDKELSLNMEQSAGLPAVQVGRVHASNFSVLEYHVGTQLLLPQLGRALQIVGGRHSQEANMVILNIMYHIAHPPDNVDVPQYILDLPETMKPKLKRPPGRPAKKGNGPLVNTRFRKA